jgi:hypothetical protein
MIIDTVIWHLQNIVNLIPRTLKDPVSKEISERVPSSSSTFTCEPLLSDKVPVYASGNNVEPTTQHESWVRKEQDQAKSSLAIGLDNLDSRKWHVINCM